MGLSFLLRIFQIINDFLFRYCYNNGSICFSDKFTHCNMKGLILVLYLHVPYADKDEVKKLGAVWNPERKQWSVRSRRDYFKFAKWFIKDDEPSIYESTYILTNYLYIIEGKQHCWKCKQETKVIGFGFGPYFEINAYDFCDETENGWLPDDTVTEVPYEINRGEEVHIAESLWPWPAGLLEYLKKVYNYHYGFSKTLQANCYANHCQSCDALQGNFFLFNEVDSPFMVESRADAEKLKLYKIDLLYDIATAYSPGYAYPADELITKFTPRMTFDSPILV